VHLAECGSKDISFPGNPQPGDMVTCLGCGASNRYDEIQKIVAKLGQDAVRDMVRDALRSLKGSSANSWLYWKILGLGS
jgi:hypothetical protein